MVDAHDAAGNAAFEHCEAHVCQLWLRRGARRALDPVNSRETPSSSHLGGEYSRA